MLLSWTLPGMILAPLLIHSALLLERSRCIYTNIWYKLGWNTMKFHFGFRPIFRGELAVSFNPPGYDSTLQDGRTVMLPPNHPPGRPKSFVGCLDNLEKNQAKDARKLDDVHTWFLAWAPGDKLLPSGSPDGSCKWSSQSLSQYSLPTTLQVSNLPFKSWGV